MEEHIALLRTLPLFEGMGDGDILRALRCFQARALSLGQAQILWDLEGCWAVIAQGGLTAEQEDRFGNRFLLGEFGPGELLGAGGLAPVGTPPLFLNVRAGTVLLLLEPARVLEPCGEDCRAHLRFLCNAARALARMEGFLLRKTAVLSRRSTRDKLMACLTAQAARQGARRFQLPYTRQELADLLAVDRSAMCTELTRMQNDGLIRYERKRFELL